jgi:hypothetical protein
VQQACCVFGLRTDRLRPTKCVSRMVLSHPRCCFLPPGRAPVWSLAVGWTTHGLIPS